MCKRARISGGADLEDADPYDPAKPEYVLHASEQDIAASECRLLEQQILKLESHLAKRRSPGLSIEPQVAQHYDRVLLEMYDSQHAAPLRQARALRRPEESAGPDVCLPRTPSLDRSPECGPSADLEPWVPSEPSSPAWVPTWLRPSEELELQRAAASPDSRIRFCDEELDSLRELGKQRGPDRAHGVPVWSA